MQRNKGGLLFFLKKDIYKRDVQNKLKFTNFMK